MERLSVVGAMTARKTSPPAVSILMVVVVAAATSQLASAQGQPPCVMDLEGCFPYLNSTSTVPNPDTCCSPLKNMVLNNAELNCLCQLFNNTQPFEQLHIDRALALGLPEKCGAGFSLTGCSADHASFSGGHLPPAADLAPAEAPGPTAGNLIETGGSSRAASTTGLLSVMISYFILWPALA